jgi:hypothetical protein
VTERTGELEVCEQDRIARFGGHPLEAGEQFAVARGDGFEVPRPLHDL